MYKLVAIDLDGTALDSYGNITERTKSAIKKVREKGINVIIASGRPMSSIATIANELWTDKYYIAGNGAIIYDMEKEKIIYGKFIPKEKILQIIKICEENSIGYNIYTEKKIISRMLKYNVLYYYKENQKKEENKRTEIMLVDDIYKHIEESEQEKFLKVTVCDENKIIFNSIMKKLKDIKKVEILEVSHMSRKIIKQGTEYVPIEYNYTEISEKNVDKWNAIEFLIKKLGIKPEEVVAIGDNVNDKKMIQNAGLGIAMKQSAPEVKKVADFITESNNEEGVAIALEKFLI